MRKHFKRILPGHEVVHSSRWLRPFSNTLLHPRLWNLNRHSVAGAVAVGLFCGLIPGPFQMLGSAFGAIVFRINLPLALIVTFYTNPLTIVPLYLAAYEIGRLALGAKAQTVTPPPDLEWGGLIAWVGQMADWAMSLGRPLGVGLVLMATLLAAVGYVTVRIAWRYWLVWQWRRRHRNRR